MKPSWSAPQRAAVAPWRLREREWTWIAWTCVCLCTVFSLWPELDLHVSQAFMGPDGQFVGRSQPLVMGVYHTVPWVGRGLALLALAVALGAWLSPGSRLRPPWRRRLAALGLSLLLGVGLMVNGALKEQWGRARPGDLALLGGNAEFSPALRPVSQCRTNCSFVSGHAATGFALMSLGMAGAPRTRRRWGIVGFAAGLLVGLGRVAQGGHFVSDVLFAGLVMWACHATVRELWLKVAARRLHRRRQGVQARTAAP